MGLAADAAGQPLLFTKENTSNGDIATVDVIYPMAPMLLLLSPSLMKASLVPVLDYSASPHWKFPNAPHDLGTYPVVMGRDDGGEGMPVEESGNMLLLCDAFAQIDGNAEFAAKWWPQLTQWAQYLEKYGLDPENQLCTDDFMGHLAHNANLSVKAILGLAAYGDMCRMRGDRPRPPSATPAWPRQDAEHWMKVAVEGDHYRLAFDKPGTWSQKYNLVWDKILGLNVFPPSVAEKEVAYYKKVMQPFGVPLDSRTKLTKTDWSLWSATLAENQADFEALVSPIYDYLNRTSARSPLVDSYVTDNLKSDGMHARPVVGGLFIKMLADRAMWKKWAGRDRARVGPWAPLPPKPEVTEIVPTSQHKAVDVALHRKEAAGRLDETRLRCRRLERRPGRLRHARDAGHRGRYGLAERRHLAAAPVHHARRRASQPPISGLSRRGRGDLRQRRAGRLRAGLYHFLRADGAERRRPRPLEARDQDHAGRALPPDQGRARRGRGAGGREVGRGDGIV